MYAFDLKKTRKHIEMDSKNTDHLNSHILNSKPKKFCLKRVFWPLSTYLTNPQQWFQHSHTFATAKVKKNIL